MQLQLNADPYKIVMMAVLLQLAHWKKSLEVYTELVRRYPTIAYFNRSRSSVVLEVIKGLGLAQKRIDQYKKIFGWVDQHGWPKNNEELAAMPAGRYIKECYQIFVLKDMKLIPNDKVLKAYLAQETNQTVLPGMTKDE